MPVESRDDLVKEVFRPDGILPANVWTIAALAEEVRSLTTRIESDAKRIVELEAERDKLRVIISASATAIGNGAMLSPECSIEFMEGLPEEISKYTDKLRRFLKCSRDEGGEALERADRAERALHEERERCARIAEETFNTSGWNAFMRSAGNSIATAIRSGKPEE